MRKVNGEYLNVAVGKENGTSSIYIDQKKMIKSSLLDRLDFSEAVTKRELQIRKLDDLLEGKSLESPYLLKIDVEGFEYNALAGAKKTLENVHLVIIEINLDNRYVGLHNNLSKINGFLQENGFCLFAVLDASVSANNKDRMVKKVDVAYERVY